MNLQDRIFIDKRGNKHRGLIRYVKYLVHRAVSILLKRYSDKEIRKLNARIDELNKRIRTVEMETTTTYGNKPIGPSLNQPFS